tara:strand:+ start:593 stop:757 length:165 start_codon:yes stop_codon:yes gene_type:complete
MTPKDILLHLLYLAIKIIDTRIDNGCDKKEIKKWKKNHLSISQIIKQIENGGIK